MKNSACVLLAAVIGCTANETSAPEKAAESAKTTAGGPAAPAAAAAQAPAQKAAKKPAAAAPCFSPWAPSGPAQASTAGGFRFTQTGTELRGESGSQDALTVGVIANIKENSPENQANLRRALTYFQAQKAEAIFVVGDLEETRAGLESVFAQLGASGLPTFTIIGNREPAPAYAAAFEAARAQHKNLFDLGQVRAVQLDDVRFVSMPGYYNPTYIHAEAGCAYTPADVQGLKAIAQSAADTTTVVVSHGGPRQDGPNALDRTLEQVNVGDPNLAAFMKGQQIDFGFFANIHESGGRATDLTGTKLIRAGKFSDAMLLNPGPIDAVRWQMNDGSESTGMAALVTFAKGQAKFEIQRFGAGS